MEVVRVFEDALYSRAYINNLFEKETIEELLLLRILKCNRGNNSNDVNGLLSIGELNFVLNENFSYSFNFVGILTVKNICLISYPKYIQNKENFIDEDYEQLKEIIEVIEKCKPKLVNIKSEIFNGTENDFNLLAFTLDLLQDYYDYGLYNNHREIVETNGNGSIFWDKTIAEMPMVISDNTPIYLDFYTYSTEDDLDSFTRRFHAYVLTRSTERVALPLSILGRNTIEISQDTIDDFGSVDYIINKLKQEYSRQFETRKQDLINKLIEYLIEVECDLEKGLSLVGTVNMKYIWEKVCASALGNCLDKTLKDLSLTYQNYKSNMKIKDVVSKPIWHVAKSDKFFESEPMKLDIIVIDSENRKTIEIYDAKYYNIIFDKHVLKDNPGVQDIAKEYLYEKTYRKFAEENCLSIVNNVFLMPGDEEVPVKLGTISMDLFSDFDLHNIDVVRWPARMMYKMYLKGEVLSYFDYFSAED